MRRTFGKLYNVKGVCMPVKKDVKTKLKLFSAEFEIWTNEIYLLPTIRLMCNNHIYCRKNLEICFHFMCFNARLFFVEREAEGAV